MVNHPFHPLELPALASLQNLTLVQRHAGTKLHLNPVLSPFVICASYSPPGHQITGMLTLAASVTPDSMAATNSGRSMTAPAEAFLAVKSRAYSSVLLSINCVLREKHGALNSTVVILANQPLILISQRGDASATTY